MLNTADMLNFIDTGKVSPAEETKSIETELSTDSKENGDVSASVPASEPATDEIKSDSAAIPDKEGGETVTDDTDNSSPEPAKQYPDKQSKVNYAFAKQKEKTRKMKEQYEAKISALNEELNKYRGLTLKDFNEDQDAYLRYLAKQNGEQAELQRLQQQHSDELEAEYARTHQQRAEMCFPDEKARETYFQMLDANSANFTDYLQKNDPEGTVLNFLGDSDYSPIVLSLLMRNADIRQRVMSKTSAIGKYAELQRIEDIARNNMASAQHQLKKDLPVLGSQAKSEGTASSVDYSDPNYWKNFCRSHHH